MKNPFKHKHTPTGYPSQQRVPPPPACAKDLTDQELEKVQGGRDPQNGLPTGQRMHKPL
jgi:hypothetical protein